MRVTKFRVFDPNTNQMIASNIGIDKIHLYDFDGDDITEQEGLIIMQYIGLHDGNNDEICESDIIYEPITNQKFVVTWDESYAMFFMKNTIELATYNDYDFAEYDVEVCNTLYVIGNIYENPELLN